MTRQQGTDHPRPPTVTAQPILSPAAKKLATSDIPPRVRRPPFESLLRHRRQRRKRTHGRSVRPPQALETLPSPGVHHGFGSESFAMLSSRRLPVGLERSPCKRGTSLASVATRPRSCTCNERASGRGAEHELLIHLIHRGFEVMMTGNQDFCFFNQDKIGCRIEPCLKRSRKAVFELLRMNKR